MSGPSRAVVVGAGLGGLAVAIRLRLAGWEVSVLERRDEVGGRAGVWREGGFAFDTGPSHLIGLEPLEALFAAAGTSLEAELPLVKLEAGCRVRFGDGESLQLSHDPHALAADIERLAPGASPAAARFLALGSELHRVGMAAVIDRAGLDVAAGLDPLNWPLLAKGVLWKRLDGLARAYFRDDRLREAFTAHALYMGMDPRRAPALYALLPAMELESGIHFPRGGMHAIPRALERVARRLGVAVQTGVAVERVIRAGDRATGVETAQGDRLDADLLVLNADLPMAYERLLGEAPPRGKRLRYTCGAFVMLLGVRGKAPELQHHNLHLPSDMPAYLRHVFDEQRVPDEPLFYLSAPTRTDPALAPEGHEAIFVLTPVPNLDSGIDWAKESPRLADRLLGLIEKRAVPGLRERLVVSRTLAPTDWAQGWSLARGAAFGLDHGLLQMADMRPRNRHQRLGNVYFVGASTHPGSGIPLVVTSARHAAERIAREQPAPAAAPARCPA
ncbi:zeta-carotene-forming phytoene desaturase [compost metagenome]